MGAPQNTGPSFVLSNFFNQFFATGQVNMVLVGNNLYAIVQQVSSGGGGINGTAVFKSTDGGTTWAEQDAAHKPTSARGEAFYDTVGNQLIFGLVTITNAPSLQPCFLQNYSFATDTWGTAYATGGPNALTFVQYCFKRPDGTILIIFNLGTLQPGGQSNLQAAFWNGSIWSSNIDVGSGIVALQANGNCAVADTVAAMDSAGNINIAFDNNLRTIFCYQQLLTNSTLGTFHQFSQTFQNSAPPFGNMSIVGTNIFLSAMSNNSADNTLFTGTPLVAPVFTANSPASLIPPMHGVNRPGPIVNDGATLYWMVTWQDAGFNNVFQVAKSTDNGVTWAFLPDNVTSPYFYDFTTSPLAPNTDPSFGIDSPSLLIGTYQGNKTLFGMVDVRNSSEGAQNTYFMNSEVVSSTPPIVASKLEISLFGVKRWNRTPDVPCAELPLPPPPIKRVM